MEDIKEVVSKLSDSTKAGILDIVNNRRDIVLVDMSNHLYKAFFVNSSLSTVIRGKEVLTGHIYGFLRAVCSMKKRLDNPAIVLCVDGYDKERKELNPDYKGNRDSSRFNVHGDTNIILEMLSLLKGIYVVHNPNREADDMMYSIAKTLDYLMVKNNMSRNIYLYTSDKDLMQTINPRIYQVRKFGDKGLSGRDLDIVDEDVVRNKFDGVSPYNLVFYRALVGDSSDNIKGYLRIPKKVASYIATNGIFGDIGVELGETVQDFESQGVTFNTVNKWLDVINSDYNLFSDNYNTMKLKLESFELTRPVSDRAMQLVIDYDLNAYKKDVAAIGSK